MSKRLKAVVVGAGQAAEGHTVALREAGVDVVAICSRTESVVGEVAQRLGIGKASTDWRRTFESEHPDVVAIATPALAHVEQIGAALDLGCHVYADKPLAVAASDARDLYERSLRADVRTAIAVTWIFDPGILYLEELVKAGAIGRPLAVDSRFLSPWPYPAAAMWINRFAEGGGVLNNRFNHQLAAVQRIVGGEVLEAMGEAHTNRRRRPDMGRLHDYREWKVLSEDELKGTSWVEVDADDSCTVLLRLGQPGMRPEEVVNASIYCSSGIRPREGRTITIYGEEGSLHFNWVADDGKSAKRVEPRISRASFSSEEWRDEAIPQRILDRLPHIAHALHRDWAALAREFVADIQGAAHEAYPTFREGWIYQEIVEIIKAGSGWVSIPR
jgi:predicted dehydrogenase